jgi:hypothetical protein
MTSPAAALTDVTSQHATTFSSINAIPRICSDLGGLLDIIDAVLEDKNTCDNNHEWMQELLGF